MAAIVNGDADATLDLLKRVVAVPSVTGNTAAVHALLRAELEQLGYTVDDVASDPNDMRGEPDFSPPTRETSGGGMVAHKPGPRGIMLFAHSDTSDHERQDGWQTDPLVLTPDDQGRVAGIGVADCKAGVVAIVAALKSLDRAGIRLRKPPAVVIAEAKTGGFTGMYQSVRQAGRSEGALYCHPGEVGDGMGRIKVATRGVLSFRITVAGRTPIPIESSARSADPRQGENALVHASRVVGAIVNWAETQPHLICSVNTIQAGRDALEVPALCVMEGTCWYTEGTITSVIDGLKSAVSKAAASNPWLAANVPEVELIGVRANPASCADSPFAVAVQDAVAAVTGTRPEPYDWHSASDIRFPMLYADTPTVGIGSIAGNFGRSGEWVDVADFMRMVEVIARVLVCWDERSAAPAAA
ncbi:M20 family metallopeptidase [Devosia albogilva]|uniref:M20 family metallopeptidase n=1 Tax=Devosia albogilva TaxID=429726 RepID=A0ABW5QIZ4_9HYPH